MNDINEVVNEIVRIFPGARVKPNGERRFKVNKLSGDDLAKVLKEIQAEPPLSFADSAKALKEIQAESTLRFKQYMRKTYPHLNI